MWGTRAVVLEANIFTKILLASVVPRVTGSQLVGCQPATTVRKVISRTKLACGGAMAAQLALSKMRQPQPNVNCAIARGAGSAVLNRSPKA